MSLVSLSFMTAERLADGMTTWKLVAFRLPSVLRLIPFCPVPWVIVAPVPEVVVPVVVVVLLMFDCKVTVALVGGSNPKVRDLSLLTCMIAMSTMTSGRALSGLRQFSASAI